MEINNEADLSELQEQRRKNNKNLYCEARIKRKFEYWRKRLKCNILIKTNQGENRKLVIGIWELPAGK